MTPLQFVLCLCSLFVIHARPEAVSGDDPPRRHALLIGCDRYENLPARRQLRGPANDVALTAELLLGPRFGIAPENIKRLVSSSADTTARPTRENIVREFETLVRRAGRGDEVFILLSGHGSRQPNDNPEADPEPDGFDEVFLPDDIPGWGPKTPRSAVITDDEIGAWLGRLQAQGAFVFLVADTCHSGTLSRGPADDEPRVASRHLPDLSSSPAATTPSDSEDRSAAKDARRDEEAIAPAERGVVPGRDAAGFAALYAVPSGVRAIEEPLPRPARDDTPVYGRLSYAFNKALRNTEGEVSYRELEQHVLWEYDRMGWDSRPYLTGTALDRSVLGAQLLVGRSDIVLTRVARRLTINAGRLHGIEPGTIFAVHPLAGMPAKPGPLPHVKVTESDITTAIVEPVEYDGVAQPDRANIPVPGRCDIRQVSLGTAELPVAVVADSSAPEDALADPNELATVRQLFNRLAEQKEAPFRSAGPGEAELYMVVRRGEVRLRRYGDAFGRAEHHTAPIFGPFPIDDTLEESLGKALRAAARAINLQKIATSQDRIGVRSELAYTVHARVVRKGSTRLTPVDPAGLELGNGDRVVLRVENTGPIAFDVNVLYIDSGFQIQSYHPSRRLVVTGEFSTTLRPGETSRGITFNIDDSTTGFEDVLLLLTESKGGRSAEFTFLEQTGLDQIPAPRSDRGVDRGGKSANPLRGLLYDTLFSPSRTRSPGADEYKAFAVRRFRWLVR